MVQKFQALWLIIWLSWGVFWLPGLPDIHKGMVGCFYLCQKSPGIVSLNTEILGIFICFMSLQSCSIMVKLDHQQNGNCVWWVQLIWH